MFIKQITDRGRQLARSGLDMGKSALERGAQRLLDTAKLLGSWSAKLAPVATEEQPVEAEVVEAEEAMPGQARSAEPA